MRLVLDHDVYAVTSLLLRSLGHDVVRISEIGLSKATDPKVLRVTQERGDSW